MRLETRKAGEQAWTPCSLSYLRGFCLQQGIEEVEAKLAEGETVRIANREFRKKKG